MTISKVDSSLQNEDGSVSVSQETGGWRFEGKGDISIQVVVESPGKTKTAHVGIYGDPTGLLQLADLLTAVASIDQKLLPDTNCPPDEGMHTTLQADVLLKDSSVTLNIGRLDAKETGDQSWFLSTDQIILRASN